MKKNTFINYGACLGLVSFDTESTHYEFTITIEQNRGEKVINYAAAMYLNGYEQYKTDCLSQYVYHEDMTDLENIAHFVKYTKEMYQMFITNVEYAIYQRVNAFYN